ncbi:MULTISPECIES: DNA-processing protein DprA [Bacillus]|uniref:DNA-processing protein DprA n=1 Tax=Bacillus TaxID=1386 RepID=UPI0003099C42|nr:MULTISPECIES: DNA-processing protein DprA [Bacillus]
MQEFREKLLLIHHCRGIGWKSIFLILQNDPHLQTLKKKSLKDWQKTLHPLNPQQIQLFYHDLHSINIDKKSEQYVENSIDYLTIFDDGYPQRLKNMYNPPWIIYMKGNKKLLNNQKMLAVVGARKFSDYSIEALDLILPQLIKKGYVIVSGLALGVDALAHKLAISHLGSTIGVLGGGLFKLYPKENIALALKMMNEQLVLSEAHPALAAEPWMFPQRNRIISGLSDGVLIVEATRRSGSLITAYHALEQGKEVFCIPGNIANPLSEGTNTLIQEGAKLVQSYKDIDQEFL